MFDKIKGYLMDVVIKKVAPRAAQVATSAIAGLLAGRHVAPLMDKFGVHVDQDQMMIGISTLVGAGLSWFWHHVGPKQTPMI